MKIFVALAVLATSVSPAFGAAVKLNIIQVCDDAGSNCAPVNLNQTFTDKIWAQTGTTFNYSSITQLNSTAYLNPTQTEANSLIDSYFGTGRERGCVPGCVLDNQIVPGLEFPRWTAK